MLKVNNYIVISFLINNSWQTYLHVNSILYQ